MEYYINGIYEKKEIKIKLIDVENENNNLTFLYSYMCINKRQNTSDELSNSYLIETEPHFKLSINELDEYSFINNKCLNCLHFHKHKFYRMSNTPPFIYDTSKYEGVYHTTCMLRFNHNDETGIGKRLYPECEFKVIKPFIDEAVSPITESLNSIIKKYISYVEYGLINLKLNSKAVYFDNNNCFLTSEEFNILMQLNKSTNIYVTDTRYVVSLFPTRHFPSYKKSILIKASNFTLSLYYQCASLCYHDVLLAEDGSWGIFFAEGNRYMLVGNDSIINEYASKFKRYICNELIY